MGTECVCATAAYQIDFGCYGFKCSFEIFYSYNSTHLNCIYAYKHIQWRINECIEREFVVWIGVRRILLYCR